MKQHYPNITSQHLNQIIDNNITHDIKSLIKHNSKFNNKIVSNNLNSYQIDIFGNNTKNNVSQHLNQLIDNYITHDIKTPIKQNSKFNNKIVSNHRHSYQINIFVNNTKNNASTSTSTPIYPYNLILININTCYVELYHLQNRSSISGENALKYNFHKINIKSLESDEEKSFLSSDVLNYLKTLEINYYVITEQQHQTLGIIDRFIRTRRDYLKKNEPANNYKINRFISCYKHIIHNETGVSSIQMQNNKALEVEYIVEKLAEQSYIENKSGYKLDASDKVHLLETNMQ
jgi:hypothetical protein